ncbi:hypothetical protein, partial [Eshraghiella crossota]|uniref:hypothetical protein n=1 Tax=Eshraghiella crossota TaxID=45851 RepID=UPI003FD8728D
MMNLAIRQLCRFKISRFYPLQNTASSLWKNVLNFFRHPLMTGWKCKCQHTFVQKVENFFVQL